MERDVLGVLLVLLLRWFVYTAFFFFGKYNDIPVVMLQYWRLHIYHLFCMAKSNN